MRKKGLASLLTAVTLAAGMLTAVPASAEGDELTLGTDYTVAAYYDKDGLINGDEVTQLDLFEKNFDRDDKKYFVSYIVFDISAVDVDKISYYAAAKDTKDKPPIAVYYTDSNDIVEKIPSEMGANGDLTGTNLNYSGFSDLYSFNSSEIPISYTNNGNNLLSGDNQDISAAKDAKYLVLACRGWPTTKFSSLSITGTKTAEGEKPVTMNGVGYDTLEAAIEDANVAGTTSTITVNEDISFSGMGEKLENGLDITINAATDKDVTITRGEAVSTCAMFRVDSAGNAGSTSRAVSLGTEGGILRIVDNSSYGGDDKRTFMIGSDGNNTLTLGPKCIVEKTQGDILLHTWGKNDTDKLVIDGAEINLVDGTKCLQVEGSGVKTTIEINGNAKLGGAVGYNPGKVNLDVSNYIGATPISLSIQGDDLASGTVVAIGLANKLSYTSDIFELADGTGGNEGKVVLAEKAAEPTEPAVITTANKLEVEGVDEATINEDAVGYYAENVTDLSGNLNEYDWLITMNDDVQFTKKVNIDTTVNTEGGVSFGIILYGKTSADADSYSTADIKTVQLTKID